MNSCSSQGRHTAARWSTARQGAGVCGADDNALREGGNRARFRSLDIEDDRAQHLLDAVRVAKSHMNLVIVTAHWGPNRGYTPQRPHIPFAHRLIDCGADIIFGHSGHVFQGIEI